jgi:hypothetical protein
MDVKQTVTGLEQALPLLEAISPALALAGPPGLAAAAVINAIGKYAGTVLDAAQAESTALSDQDLASVQAAVAAIQQSNAVLAAQVATS